MTLGIILIIAGVLIALFPRLLAFIVAFILILEGVFIISCPELTNAAPKGLMILLSISFCTGRVKLRQLGRNLLPA